MKTKLIATAFAFGLIATSCGTSLDREGTIDELMSSGLSRPVAECVVDRAVEELGEDRVISDDEPTAEEQQILTDIAIECATSGG